MFWLAHLWKTTVMLPGLLIGSGIWDPHILAEIGLSFSSNTLIAIGIGRKWKINVCLFHSNPKMRHLNKVELAPIRFLEDKVVKSEVDPSTIGISNLHLGSLLFFFKIHYLHDCIAGWLWMFKKVKVTLSHLRWGFLRKWKWSLQHDYEYLRNWKWHFYIAVRFFKKVKVRTSCHLLWDHIVRVVERIVRRRHLFKAAWFQLKTQIPTPVWLDYLKKARGN